MSVLPDVKRFTPASCPEVVAALLNVTKHYPVRTTLLGRVLEEVHAVDNVTLELKRGEVLSLVGESGCGKSTTGRLLLCLEKPDEGRVFLCGSQVSHLSFAAMRRVRHRISAVFQDPMSSLNPRRRVWDQIAMPILNFGRAKDRSDIDYRIARLVDLVGLPADTPSRFPHEFSGGQRQRICIARALAAEPEVIVCDEAVSALDVSAKAQIINLLKDLQRELGLSLTFISHDLAAVEQITDGVAVMYLGKIVEEGHRSQVFAKPLHPYTKALLDSVPAETPDQRKRHDPLKGDVPTPMNPPNGCRFHTRCPVAVSVCSAQEPPLKAAGPGRKVACHLV